MCDPNQKYQILPTQLAAGRQPSAMAKRVWLIENMIEKGFANKKMH